MLWPAPPYGCVLIQVEWSRCAWRSQLPLNHLSVICVCEEERGGGGESDISDLLCQLRSYPGKGGRKLSFLPFGARVCASFLQTWVGWNPVRARRGWDGTWYDPSVMGGMELGTTQA